MNKKPKDIMSDETVAWIFGTIVASVMTMVVLLYAFNAIYINNSIPTLDGWTLIDSGRYDIQGRSDTDCYRKGSDSIYYSIGETEINEKYNYYTPIPTCGGFVNVRYSNIPLRNTFKLYKHPSIIPIWSDYLIVCYQEEGLTDVYNQWIERGGNGK